MPAHDTVLSDTIRYDTIRYNTTRHDTTRHDTIHARHRCPKLFHSALFRVQLSPVSYAMLPWPNTHSHGIETGQHLLKSVFCFPRFDQVRHHGSLISQPRSPSQRPRLSCHAMPWPHFQRRLEFLSKLCILLIE